MIILTILIIWIHEHSMSFHPFVLSSVSFLIVLKFSEYRSFTSLGRFVPKYFILWCSCIIGCFLSENRFIIRNWLMWLWRQACSKICRVSEQAEDGVPESLWWLPSSQCPKAWEPGGNLSKGQHLETEEELMFLFESKVRKKEKSWFPGSHAGRIVSHLGKGLPFCSI